MTETEIETIIQRTFLRMVESDEFKRIVDVHCNTRLSAFGIDWQSTDGIREFIADQLYLRAWRKSVQKATSVTWITVLTVIVTGLLGAIWLGISTMRH
jgi:hypothetical protein